MKKNIIGNLLKFAGYIHSHKILPGNIFGLILKNEMAATAVFSTWSKDFCWPSRAKGIIGNLLKFAGYIHNHKILPGNIFGLILKNKMAATAVFSTLSKDFCWPSRAKGIIGNLLKFAGYIHNHKILPGNIFGLILKNEMAATAVFSTLSKDFCWPSRAKGIIGRDLKFTAYVPHYKILTGNIFGLIWKNKMVATAHGCFFVNHKKCLLLQGQMKIAKLKSAYNSLIIGPRGVGW